ncbi:hypothetical protein [Borrelia persica]|uniref:hypothetical protein n=1 Tax=Borrelia persica TaxID=44448 RepID=UPI0004B09398|nr:hypothetical protein [Borrelia persica]
MSEEVQSKRLDETIVKFPIFIPENFDYVYAYLKEWVAKKYRDNLNITIKQVDGGILL